jgi:hypothetical protein
MYILSHIVIIIKVSTDMKKKQILILILLLTAGFIATNLFFYFKTTTLRAEKKFHVSLILKASSIEQDSFEQLAKMDDLSETEIGEGTLIFVKRHNELKKNAFLDTLDLRLKQLNSYIDNPNDNIQPQILKGLYVNLNAECRKVMINLLRLNRKIDNELAGYFNFGFSFIFFVSGVTFLILLISLFRIKSVD